MQNIANYHHLRPLHRAQMLPHGIEVEEALSGMGMATIAAVYHDYIDMLSNEVRGSGMVVAHHDGIGAQGLDGADGIDEGFPFLTTATGSTDVNHIGAEALCRLLEGDAGAGAGLIEHSNQGLAPERGHLLDLTPENLLHGIGGFKNQLYLLPGEVVEVKDVTAAQRLCRQGRHRLR
ncbi:hypothetical protein ES703_116004 [subsurface metagenome]